MSFELILGILIGVGGGVIGAVAREVYTRRRGGPTFRFIDLVQAVENAKSERLDRPDHMDRAFVEGADAVLGQLLQRPDTGEEEMRMAYSVSGHEPIDPEPSREEA